MAELVIRVLEVLEAEGKLLRVHAVRVALAMGLALLVILLVGGGLAFLLWGLYLALEPSVGATGASLLVGFVSLLLGGVLAWTTMRWLEDRK